MPATQDQLSQAEKCAANSRAEHEEVNGQLNARLQQELVDGPLLLPRFQLEYTQVFPAAGLETASSSILSAAFFLTQVMCCRAWIEFGLCGLTW